jgi:hypothetical protein
MTHQAASARNLAMFYRDLFGMPVTSFVFERSLA